MRAQEKAQQEELERQRAELERQRRELEEMGAKKTKEMQVGSVCFWIICFLNGKKKNDRPVSASCLLKNRRFWRSSELPRSERKKNRMVDALLMRFCCRKPRFAKKSVARPKNSLASNAKSTSRLRGKGCLS